MAILPVHGFSFVMSWPLFGLVHGRKRQRERIRRIFFIIAKGADVLVLDDTDHSAIIRQSDDKFNKP